MTLTQLRVFWIVASSRSLSEAAHSLNLTQASVSMHLRALERDLGVELYERGHRGEVVLSTAGHVFFGHVETILNAATQAQRELSALQRDTGKRLRVGANTTGGMYVLPEITRRYRKILPDVDVQPMFESTVKVVDLVLHGQLDVGLAAGPVDKKRFEIMSSCPDELMLITSPDHRFASRGKALLTDLISESVVLPGTGSRSRWLLESTLNQAGLRAKAYLTMNNTEDVKRAVIGNLGVGFVSRYSILCEVAAKSLVAVEIPGLRIRRNFELFWQNGQVAPPHFLPLKQLADEVFRELDAKANRILPVTS
ncbi:MAG: LysR family transcriptional regulator [Dehalococcoidia bacterium]|nr:LysR family transcriptional regulator [Dehalococcoidia bacterium]